MFLIFICIANIFLIGVKCMTGPFTAHAFGPDSAIHLLMCSTSSICLNIIEAEGTQAYT